MKEKEGKVVRKVNMDKGRPCTCLWTTKQLKKTDLTLWVKGLTVCNQVKVWRETRCWSIGTPLWVSFRHYNSEGKIQYTGKEAYSLGSESKYDNQEGYTALEKDCLEQLITWGCDSGHKFWHHWGCWQPRKPNDILYYESLPADKLKYSLWRKVLFEVHR